MGPIFKQAGLFRLIFVALLVLFNWPVLSIPGPQTLPLWLLGVWALGIACLWFASRCVPSAGFAAPPVAPPLKPPASPGGGTDV